MISFASDNNSGVSNEVLKKLNEVNSAHAIGYGEDKFTQRVIELFQNNFGKQVKPYLVFTGTAANVMSIASACAPFHCVLSADTAHINVDECGAPQRFTGCSIETVNAVNGKITVEQLKPLLNNVGFEHHSQPKLISITQSTELGTVYNVDEIKKLAKFAHQNNMYLHMDGARLANAAVTLNLPFKKFTTDAGVDILSFGGTKNGLMSAESVVFLNSDLDENFKYIRKQGMQLVSKMRYVAAQFLAYFEDELWKKNASHANKLAKLLAEKIKDIPEIQIIQPVESNAVFARIPKSLIEPLQKEYFFYVWDYLNDEVRWMTSFDTTEEDVLNFVNAIKKLIRKL